MYLINRVCVVGGCALLLTACGGESPTGPSAVQAAAVTPAVVCTTIFHPPTTESQIVLIGGVATVVLVPIPAWTEQVCH